MDSLEDFQIKVIRSSRRKKTVQAKLIDGVLRIYLPKGLTKTEEEKWVNHMRESFLRKLRLNRSDESLRIRADRLNKKFFNGELEFDIRYVSNQNKRFGSCTPKTKKIRISDRVAKMPWWVQDYVVLHELTHLIHPNHSKEFWEKVNEYRYTERAKGYLIAVGMNKDIEETIE